MKRTGSPEPPRGADRELLRRQQRRHLVSLYLAACDYARQLEGAIREGRSPTGFGSPLSPLPPEQADAVLGPVGDFLQQLREFVEAHAPEELRSHELVQAESNTSVWASNLLERLRQLAEELGPERLNRYGQTTLPLAELEKRKHDLLEAIGRARQELRP